MRRRNRGWNSRGDAARMEWIMKHAMLVACALFAMASAARADFDTGHRLLEKCQSPQLDQTSYCLGYVAAVSDAVRSNYLGDWTACIPHEATLGQVRDIAVGFLERQPATRDLAAWSLISRALAEAWPCSR
jgi:hypothetical protein